MTQTLSKIFFSLIKNITIHYFFLFFFSILICYYSGYRGVFPLDSFIIFNSGYKILNGLYPFKDYWSITGPMLDFLQYFFFKIFSVNWFSYVLHAALINCLLTLSTYYFFLKLEIKKEVSFLFAIGVSILGYPSAGTPFVDHHASIFSLLSIEFFILSFLFEKKIYWLFSGVLIIFSFASKQIPSIYLFILMSFFLFLFVNTLKKNNNFLYFVYGIALTIFIFFLSIFLLDISLENLLIQYIFYPISIGNERASSFSANIWSIILQFKFIFLSILPLIYILFKRFEKKIYVRKDKIIILFALFSFIIFIYCQIITKNQIFIFFLIPFYLGLSYFFYKKIIGKNIYFFIFIFLIFIISTTKYHIRFNIDKKFMDLENYKISNAVDARLLDNMFVGLKWITFNYPDDPKHEINLLNETKKIISKDKENIYMVTDYQFLAAASKIKDYSANKWYDNVSMPDKKNKYFEFYKKFIISNIKKHQISNFYFIGTDENDFFEIILDNKNCYKKNKLNEITSKIEIKNCTNFLKY